MKKAIKILGVLILVYAGIIVLFESLLGYFQPAGESTLVITSSDEEGVSSKRVLARLESDGVLYVAANHWPRAWFRRVSENPQVHIRSSTEDGDYLAMAVGDLEHERVDNDNRLGIGFRILTGFPPRYFLRLEPVQATAD